MEASELRRLIGGRRYVFKYRQATRKTISVNKIIGRYLRTTRGHTWFLAPNGAIRRVRNGDIMEVT